MAKHIKIEFSEGELFVCGKQTTLMDWYGYKLEGEPANRKVKICKDIFSKGNSRFVCTEFDEDICRALLKKID